VKLNVYTSEYTVSSLERVKVMRGRYADDHLAGPFAGARIGEVVAYDFELPPSFEPWPGRTRRERTFVLLDLGVSFANPCWARHTNPDGTTVDRRAEGRDTWYVDLVAVEEMGNTLSFRDLYIDVMVPMDGRHYRLLDLDEFADAIDSGVLTTKHATEALRRWQRFLDRHLHTERAPSNTWTDFPPASIRPLVDLQSFTPAASRRAHRAR
jgi:Protein of unknown function (DUF402)